MAKRAIILTIISVLLTLLSAGGTTPTKIQKASPPASNPPTQAEHKDLPGPQKDGESELAVLREQVQNLSDKMNFYLLVATIILTVFLAIPVFGSAYSMLRAEARSGQAHELMLSGERAAQGRAEQVHQAFLQSSKDTLELVNATLTLAKEASERAATLIEEKARGILHDLDQEARYLIESIPSDDDRRLVADPASRSRLRTLAQKIARISHDGCVECVWGAD
jgi:uncharacterized membrane protein